MAAEAAISSSVKFLGDLLILKVNFLRGVEEKVELLKDELKRMGCFLKDANRKQADDESVRNWISDIREVAHDAKDVIEMFVLKIERKGMMGRISSFTKHVHYINKVGKQIDSIQKRLEAISRSRHMYGIRDLGEASESVWRSQVESRRRLPAWQSDEHLVGMKDDVRKIVQEWILYDDDDDEEEEERSRVSVGVIEGMGGIGKSTLARKIYNHHDVVSGRFECRGWVVVSSEFTLQETIKQIIFQLQSTEEKKQRVVEEIKKLGELMNDEIYIQGKLKEMLHELLEGKSYFIVLDDVWEIKHLESLINAFPYLQGKTSRLLITTRNRAIANLYGDYALEMNVLDLDKSWELFNKTAFHNSHTQCPEELEQIGRDIVEKCNGLPLAITAVGGLLVDTQTTSGWKDVLDQVNSHSGRAETIISTILEMSYQNLSPHLKSCFLCLASFKEDANIPTKLLIHIWIGQGLIQPEGRRTMEEIGRSYLDELINRNMVQIKDLTVDARVKNCHLHDLFHEVCLAKAKEEIGFEIVKAEVGVSSDHEPLCKPRHRVVYGGSLDTLSSDQNNYLRSLFVHNASVGGSGIEYYVSKPFRFWKSFKLLEILCLEGVGLSRFPHSFRSLIGLRYLRIRCGSSETLKIPSWFDHLKRIEVVDARDEDVEFPSATLKMEKLRFFRAAHVYGLMSIESWKSIETLEYISLENLMKCTSTSTTISPCPIRELGLFLDGEREGEELRRARERLEKMGELVKLHLIWDLSLSIEPEMIPHLPNLTKLKLRGRMRECPSSSMFPPNLSHLTLVETFIEEDPMAELGKLPNLLYLKLTGYACMGERMRVLHDGFPGLRGLSLKGMYFLRGIDVEEGGMPQLKLLSIRRCPDLVTKNLPQHITVSLLAA